MPNLGGTGKIEEQLKEEGINQEGGQKEEGIRDKEWVNVEGNIAESTLRSIRPGGTL